MNTYPIPIYVFVSRNIQKSEVTKITSDWRVEPAKLQDYLIRAFNEIGIYIVKPNEHDLVLKTMIFLLKNAPEIKALVKRAEREEQEKRKTRHAEG